MRKQSVSKFKEKFLKEELLKRKADEIKRYTSKNQFDNAFISYRFLPKDRQKKIAKDFKIIIDQKEREK